MSPARGQCDAAFASVRKRGVGGVAVSLHVASEVGGDDAVQTSRGATGAPGEADVGAGSFAGPEVALFNLPVAKTQILDRSRANLHITYGHDYGVDVLINRAQPVNGESEPACHALA